MQYPYRRKSKSQYRMIDLVVQIRESYIAWPMSPSAASFRLLLFSIPKRRTSCAPFGLISVRGSGKGCRFFSLDESYESPFLLPLQVFVEEGLHGSVKVEAVLLVVEAMPFILLYHIFHFDSPFA